MAALKSLNTKSLLKFTRKLTRIALFYSTILTNNIFTNLSSKRVHSLFLSRSDHLFVQNYIKRKHKL